jgi:integrase
VQVVVADNGPPHDLVLIGEIDLIPGCPRRCWCPRWCARNSVTRARRRRFARVTAALWMGVEDLRPPGAGCQIRLHEKGGKDQATPCHHALADALRAYTDAAGIAEDRKGCLFRTARRRSATVLSDQPVMQPDARRMIRRRAVAVGIMAPIGNHSFSTTGITAYRSNGGVLEHAREVAAHESPRTTKLYDRMKQRLTQNQWRGSHFNV